MFPSEPTWSHRIHLRVWIFIHRFERNETINQARKVSGPTAVQKFVQFWVRILFLHRSQSVSLIKRHFGLIKKWSIVNRSGVRETFGSLQVADSFQATVGQKIFQSAFLLRPLGNHPKTYSNFLWLHIALMRSFSHFAFIYIFYTLFATKFFAAFYFTNSLTLYNAQNYFNSLTAPILTIFFLPFFSRKSIYNQLK